MRPATPGAAPRLPTNWPRGVASLYAWGLSLPGRSFDEFTRLEFKNVIGCVVDERSAGRVTGHDDAIVEQLDAVGLVSGLFNPWEGSIARARAVYVLRRHEMLGHPDRAASRASRFSSRAMTAASTGRRSPRDSSISSFVRRRRISIIEPSR